MLVLPTENSHAILYEPIHYGIPIETPSNTGAELESNDGRSFSLDLSEHSSVRETHLE